MSQLRRSRRRVDGVLMIDKPAGMTSNGVLGVVKRLFNADKAGHTGTLDPFATGLLPVTLGEATKFSSRLIDANKTYLATMRLGVTTATGDLDGAVLETRTVAVTTSAIKEALGCFIGEIDQVPPMYSALKRDGKPLYEYARAGIEVERVARRVFIDAIELVQHQGDEVVFRVACSKGTYIRTLAEDIGRRLGCGAHLTALRREVTGGFNLDGALTLAVIEATPADLRDGLLQAVDTMIRDVPRLDCKNEDAARLRLGQRLAMYSLGVTDEGLYRVYDQAGALTGLVQAVSGSIRPERLVAQGSSGGI